MIVGLEVGDLRFWAPANHPTRTLLEWLPGLLHQHTRHQCGPTELLCANATIREVV